MNEYEEADWSVEKQDNMPNPHCLSGEFWWIIKIRVLELPPHSPDIASCDLFMFTLGQVCTERNNTWDLIVEAVKQKATEVMNVRLDNDFKHCSDKWKTRMERCMDHEGVYI